MTTTQKDSTCEDLCKIRRQIADLCKKVKEEGTGDRGPSVQELERAIKERDAAEHKQRLVLQLVRQQVTVGGDKVKPLEGLTIDDCIRAMFHFYKVGYISASFQAPSSTSLDWGDVDKSYKALKAHGSGDSGDSEAAEDEAKLRLFNQKTAVPVHQITADPTSDSGKATRRVFTLDAFEIKGVPFFYHFEVIRQRDKAYELRVKEATQLAEAAQCKNAPLVPGLAIEKGKEKACDGPIGQNELIDIASVEREEDGEIMVTARVASGDTSTCLLKAFKIDEMAEYKPYDGSTPNDFFQNRGSTENFSVWKGKLEAFAEHIGKLLSAASKARGQQEEAQATPKVSQKKKGTAGQKKAVVAASTQKQKQKKAPKATAAQDTAKEKENAKDCVTKKMLEGLNRQDAEIECDPIESSDGRVTRSQRNSS